MTGEEIAVAILLAILAAELCEYLTWLAKKIAHAAAYLRYGQTERAKVRAEEWVKLIEERPGQILKIGSALGFLVTGTYVACGRRAHAAWPRLRRRVERWEEKVGKRKASKILWWIAGTITVGVANNYLPTVGLMTAYAIMGAIGASLYGFVYFRSHWLRRRMTRRVASLRAHTGSRR